MVLERFSSMDTLAKKLAFIGGSGKFEVREWRIKRELGWFGKASSTIRHLLHGEQKPNLAEAKEIEIAHVRMCAKKIEANREENAELFESMRQALDAMQRSDPEFYAPHIEAIRNSMFRIGNMGSE